MPKSVLPSHHSAADCDEGPYSREQVQDDIRPSSMDAGAMLNLQKELLAGRPLVDYACMRV
jgi:hypothetical protein